MEIRCPDCGDDGRKEMFPATHEEIHPTTILSVVVNLTPWSDHNQSPRNMYQCQMANQTMGFCGQALKFCTDVKHSTCSSIKAARVSATELVVSVRNGVGVVARLPNGEGDEIRRKKGD